MCGDIADFGMQIAECGMGKANSKIKRETRTRG